jgi:DNA sulfur modification protein DndD
MKIESIKIKNFRQYYDDNLISFSTDEKRNITLIHGENGVGKTALLNAIKWAFFNTFTNNFRDSSHLVNNSAKKNGTKTCSVEVLFQEDSTRYSLFRIFSEINNKSDLKLYKITEGVYGPALDQPDMIINSFLPKEMGEYFFFQGEGSNAVEVGNRGSNLAKSIRDILGFRVAEELIVDLGKIEKQIRQDISKSDTSGEAEKIEKTIVSRELLIKQYADSQTLAEEILPVKERELDEVESKLSKINNKDLEDLRLREKKIESEIVRCRSRMANLVKDKHTNIGKFGWAIFGYKFANRSLDFIDESQLKGRLPEPYNQTFIEDILEAKKCICGNELCSDSDGFKNITTMLSKAANPVLQSRLAGIRAQIQDVNTLYDLSRDNLASTISQYDDKEEELQGYILSLKDVKLQIEGIPEHDIQSLTKIKKNLRNDIANHGQMLARAKDNIDRIQREVQAENIKLRAVTPNTGAVENLKSKLTFVGGIISFIRSHLDKTEKNIRLHVLDEVNNTLAKFSRHDFKIRVNESNFSISLLDKDDNKVAQGDGLNLLLNLTITAALISFVNKNRRVKDAILTSATVAPLVIDAPFGVLDSKYRNVVVELLPQFAEQVIFLVSSSQWTEEMDGTVRDLVGKEYNLILEESSQKGQKEPDKISILGKDYLLSRYECDVDRTVVEEVIV